MNSNSIIPNILSAFLLMLFVPCVTAQITTSSFLDQVSDQFGQSSAKLVALAEEFQDDDYQWSPDGEAMTVAEVFLHIARYNYTIPSGWLGAEIPRDVDLDSFDHIQNKEEVIAELRRSIAHVQAHIPQFSDEMLTEPTEIFGIETENWGTLFLLISHMSEHVGQLISYARMNDITPPWSR